MFHSIRKKLKTTFVYQVYIIILHRWSMFSEIFFEMRLLKYNGTISMKKDQKKLENRILISIHGIEKGLSFREPRPCFGIDKIIYLLDNLTYSLQSYKNEKFVIQCLPTIKGYIIRYSEYKSELSSIIEKYNYLEKAVKKEIRESNGTIVIEKKDIEDILKNIDYESFVASRHSCRYFSKEPIDKEALYEAFRLAQFAPTSCNRQPQKVYVFEGDMKDKLLKAREGGFIGFSNEINAALLVTVDMKAFFYEELHQAYVDGGLYSMCLLHALHAQGFGTIPLTMGHYSGKRRKKLKEFSIPESETPILIIGIGNYMDSYKVNISKRRDYSEYIYEK